MSSLFALYNPHNLYSFFLFQRKCKVVYTNLFKEAHSVQEMEGLVFCFLIQIDLALSFPNFLLGFGATAVTQDLEGLLYLPSEEG